MEKDRRGKNRDSEDVRKEIRNFAKEKDRKGKKRDMEVGRDK